MRKATCWLVALTAFLAVGCNDGNKTEKAPEVYVIEYECWNETSGAWGEIPTVMWKTDGSYPTEIEENTQVKIDDLRNYPKNDDTMYVFNGWYYDAECKEALIENTLGDVFGDITLYAKIVEEERSDDVVTSKISYQWNNYGELYDGIDNFPAAMTEGLEIPTEYVEGETLALPKLNLWKKNSKIVYEFEGWYYDEEFREKVAGGVIPSTKTGDLILYAKIFAYVN